ncbi:hypothetical protein DFH06DRAFT_191957 [Mycena polygramma]|nr:hypothetical protein DFH06DRAFT_191957 [Mycena polygramma]
MRYVRLLVLTPILVGYAALQRSSRPSVARRSICAHPRHIGYDFGPAAPHRDCIHGLSWAGYVCGGSAAAAQRMRSGWVGMRVNAPVGASSCGFRRRWASGQRGGCGCVPRGGGRAAAAAVADGMGRLEGRFECVAEMSASVERRGGAKVYAYCTMLEARASASAIDAAAGRCVAEMVPRWGVLDASYARSRRRSGWVRPSRWGSWRWYWGWKWGNKSVRAHPAQDGVGHGEERMMRPTPPMGEAITGWVKRTAQSRRMKRKSGAEEAPYLARSHEPGVLCLAALLLVGRLRVLLRKNCRPPIANGSRALTLSRSCWASSPAILRKNERRLKTRACRQSSADVYPSIRIFAGHGRDVNYASIRRVRGLPERPGRHFPCGVRFLHRDH